MKPMPKQYYDADVPESVSEAVSALKAGRAIGLPNWTLAQNKEYGRLMSCTFINLLFNALAAKTSKEDAIKWCELASKITPSYSVDAIRKTPVAEFVEILARIGNVNAEISEFIKEADETWKHADFDAYDLMEVTSVAMGCVAVGYREMVSRVAESIKRQEIERSGNLEFNPISVVALNAIPGLEMQQDA